MSADLVGSSALKSVRSRGSEWVIHFNAFYHQFASMVSQESGTDFVLWKCLGDEMIYYTELKKSREAVEYIEKFRSAVRRFNESWSVKAKSQMEGSSETGTNAVKLELKATAWTAGFPVLNAAVQIPGSKTKDFIGPCMDIGFRLGKVADHRRFVISVELACILLNRTTPFRMFYDGNTELKGVLQERAYPQIWIDMLESEDHNLEHKLRGGPPSPNDLLQFCREFIDSQGGQLIYPFIEGDSEFGRKPDGWDERYKEACLAQSQELIDFSDKELPDKVAPENQSSLTEMRQKLEKLRATINKKSP